MMSTKLTKDKRAIKMDNFSAKGPRIVSPLCFHHNLHPYFLRCNFQNFAFTSYLNHRVKGLFKYQPGSCLPTSSRKANHDDLHS